jgi:hypothetical protein
MLLGLWPNYWDEWSLNHKVSFDGINKLIIVHPEVTELSIKIDVYSDWKEWVMLYDNTQYLQAIRSIGGDPIGGGQYAGDIYFLMNGWKIYIDHAVDVIGVIYSDDQTTPFEVPDETYIVTNKVSSLVQTVDVTGGGATPAQIWSYATRALTDKADFTIAGTKTRLDQLNDVTSTQIWTNPTRSLTDKANFTIAGTKTTLDQLNDLSLAQVSGLISSFDCITLGQLKEMLFMRTNTIVNKQITTYQVNSGTIIDVTYDGDGIPTSETLR